MPTALVTMNPTELERLALMRRIAERRTTQREVATQLGLSVRQVERLYAAFKRGGAAELVSKKRGAPSNRKLDGAYQALVLGIVRERYADFGPTLAREKLVELHGLSPSVETLRKWMLDDGLWVTRRQRRKRVQQPRRRRECLGELVQIDGSDHEWFEDRGPRCTLLVYVDDATSQLMELRFARSESTFDYFTATRSYLERRHLCQLGCREGTRRTGQSDAAGSLGQRDAASGRFRSRRGQCVRAGVPAGIQRSFRSGAPKSARCPPPSPPSRAVEQRVHPAAGGRDRRGHASRTCYPGGVTLQVDRDAPLITAQVLGCFSRRRLSKGHPTSLLGRTARHF